MLFFGYFFLQMKGHVQTFVLTRNAWTEGIDPVSVTSSFCNFGHNMQAGLCTLLQNPKGILRPNPLFMYSKEKKVHRSRFIHFKAFTSGVWEKKIISKANRLYWIFYSPRYLKPYKQDHAMTSDKIFADVKIFSKYRTYLSISAF